MIFPLFLYFFNFLNFLPLFPGAIIDDAAAVRRIITSVCPRNYNPTFPPVVVKNKVTVFFFTRVQFSRFDAPACRTLARICNIGEGRWSTRSRRARGGLGIDCGECGRWASGRTRRVSWSRRSALCPILCPGGDRRSSRRYLSSAENKRRKRGKLIDKNRYTFDWRNDTGTLTAIGQIGQQVPGFAGNGSLQAIEQTVSLQLSFPPVSQVHEVHEFGCQVDPSGCVPFAWSTQKARHRHICERQ